MSREGVDEARHLMVRLTKEAAAGGYRINSDEELVLDLMEGLLTNQARYGYWACPCRLADGTREQDLDIICPCYYRDPDLAEFGACYCALYVADEVAAGTRKLAPVPERRGDGPPPTAGPSDDRSVFPGASQPVWRCRVCGYLCARPKPPLKCPVCKADQDRFERFA